MLEQQSTASDVKHPGINRAASILIMMLALLVGAGSVVVLDSGVAHAAPDRGNAELSVAAPTAASKQASAGRPAGPAKVVGFTDCIATVGSVGGALAGAGAWGYVSALATTWQCGSWLGWVNAWHICWASNQWWGAYYRYVVRILTGWRYSRC